MSDTENEAPAENVEGELMNPGLPNADQPDQPGQQAGLDQQVGGGAQLIPENVTVNVGAGQQPPLQDMLVLHEQVNPDGSISYHGTTNNVAANLAGAQGPPVPMPAPEVKLPPLMEHKLRHLQPKLEVLLMKEVDIGTAEGPAQLHEIVQVYMREARHKMPAHEKLLGRMKAILGSGKAALGAIESMLAKATTKDDPDHNLGMANRELQNWYDVQAPVLQTIFKELPDAWYQPGDDPALAAIDEMRRTMDGAAQRVKKARKDAGLSSEETTASSDKSNVQLHAPKPLARQLDVKPFVATFTGLGDPGERIQKYQTWREDWEACKTHLMTRCLDCNEAVLLMKMRSTLGGAAADLVANIPSKSPTGVADVLTRLDNNYGDGVGIATNFLNHIRTAQAPAKIVKHHRDSLAQMVVIKEALEEEKLDTLEFVTLVGLVSSLPEEAQNSWNGRVVQLRETAKAAKLPWTKSVALNSTVYLAWLDEYTASHPIKAEDSDGAVANNFLAGVSKQRKETNVPNQGCFIHPKEFHKIWDCPQLSSMPFKEYVDAAKKAGTCFVCLAPFGQGHVCRSLCRHCNGRHPSVRCSRARFQQQQQLPQSQPHGRGGYGGGPKGSKPSYAKNNNGGGYGNRNPSSSNVSMASMDVKKEIQSGVAAGIAQALANQPTNVDHAQRASSSRENVGFGNNGGFNNNGSLGGSGANGGNGAKRSRPAKARAAKKQRKQ